MSNKRDADGVQLASLLIACSRHWMSGPGRGRYTAECCVCWKTWHGLLGRIRDARMRHIVDHVVRLRRKQVQAILMLVELGEWPLTAYDQIVGDSHG